MAILVPSGRGNLPFFVPLQVPRDVRAFPGQLFAALHNTLRDKRFVLAAVRVS